MSTVGPGPIEHRLSRRAFLAITAVLGLRSPWTRGQRQPAVGIDELVAQLTLEEKIALVHGVPTAGYTGYVPPNRRLRIPALTLTDGTAGVRGGPPATAFPAELAVAASFDPDLAASVGAAMASEAKYLGLNVLFAPGANLVRVPQGGRSFEYLGEDPLLAASMVTAIVRGIQSQGVIATVKHWICNDQEADRHLVSAQVDERTLRELYLPAFEAAVTVGGAGAVMAANNRVNGRYCAEDPGLLLGLLKGELGFAGFVVSDYAATHDPVAAANGGLDLDLPDDEHFGAPLLAAVKAGTVPLATLDDKCRRILVSMRGAGILDGAQPGGPGSLNTPEHQRVAFEAAVGSLVLLENRGGALPFDGASIRRLAVIGRFAMAPKVGGLGSSAMVPFATTNLVDALTEELGPAAVGYEAGATTGELIDVPAHVLSPPGRPAERGLLGEYFANATLAGAPVFSRVDPFVDVAFGGHGPGPGIGIDGFSIRWTGMLVPPATGTYRFTVAARTGARLTVGAATVIDAWKKGKGSGTIALTAGRAVPLKLEYRALTGSAAVRLTWVVPGSPEADPAGALARAVALAGSADAAVVLVADVAGESLDRPNLVLPGNQDQLVAAVAAANPRTVVVACTSGAIDTRRWARAVPGLVQAWYGGQAGASALAAVLLGTRDPGGRLPVSFADDLGAYPAKTPVQYPGVGHEVHYDEGVLVGYRWFDAKAVAPTYPFGHGLSYTSFSYSDLSVAAGPGPAATIAFTVRNTGSRAGTEVAQVYLRPPTVAGLVQAPQRLAGFAKLALSAGASQRVTISVGRRSLSYWSAAAHDWVVASGTYGVAVSRSSRDHQLTGSFSI